VSGATQQVISVAELNRRLRQAVEQVAGLQWVEGELTSLRSAASGHVYFSLKDEREDASVDCVIYRFQAQRARRYLAEGARLQVRGRATVWSPRGRLQFVVAEVRLQGRGALLEALEQLKQRLSAEGLFSADRKRPLPAETRVMGVVTSAAGAALHDICTVAFRRGSVRIVLAPALVQGDRAAQSILEAVELIERYPGLDVLIIGRGGGSSDDLMAFNDERLVRRIARVAVPVISAVGHEIDTTLTDLVADVRAATPSQAAELAVADQRERQDTLRRCLAQLARAAGARLLRAHTTVDRLRARVSDPRIVIAERQQQVDELVLRLERRLTRALSRRRSMLEELSHRLLARHPRTVLARCRAGLEPLLARLLAGVTLKLRQCGSARLEPAARLQGLSPVAVLARGYAIVARSDGRAVVDAADLSVGDFIGIRLHRGRVGAEVRGVFRDSGSDRRRLGVGGKTDDTGQR
jgi:exodeoxyribonuclease VII large subunit